jgi:hypothetical protein
MPCWHKWGQWSKPYSKKLVSYIYSFGLQISGPSEPYIEWFQKKECLKCRKMKERKV